MKLIVRDGLIRGRGDKNGIEVPRSDLEQTLRRENILPGSGVHSHVAVQHGVEHYFDYLKIEGGEPKFRTDYSRDFDYDDVYVGPDISLAFSLTEDRLIGEYVVSVGGDVYETVREIMRSTGRERFIAYSPEYADHFEEDFDRRGDFIYAVL